MILGVVTRLEPDVLRPWMASARTACPTERIVLLADPSAPYAAVAETYGVEVRPVVLRAAGEGVCDVTWTRWPAIAAVLEDETEPVCLVDTRDAVFQANPLAGLDGHLRIGSEAKRHHENDWTIGWVRHLWPAWESTLRDQPILCAGAIAGPAPLLRDFAERVHAGLPRLHCDCTSGQAHMVDQLYVNLLAYTAWQDRFTVTTDWCFHVMSMDGHPRIPADLRDDGRIYRPDGTLFPLVHQWDRHPQLTHFGTIR